MPRATDPTDPPLKQCHDQLKATARNLRQLAKMNDGGWSSAYFTPLNDEATRIEELIGFLSSTGAFG
jgi:hypothetical protein